MKIERISSRQLTWLIISVNLSASMILGPSVIIFYAKQSAWLSSLLAAVLAAAGALLSLHLIRCFPGQTVAQFAQKLLGPWFGKPIGFYYSLVSFYMVGVCLRLISQLVKMTLMPETPLWPFILGLTLLVVYSAWLGLEAIARANDLILPFSLVGLVFMLLLAAPEGRPYWGLPVWQLNLPGIVMGTFTPLACFGEVFLILLIAPALNKPTELRTAVVRGILTAGLILAAITQFVLFMMGSYRASAYFVPVMRIAEELSILDIFERFEPLVLAGWLMINSVKMSLLTYAGARSLTETLNRQNYRPVALAALLVLPLLAFLPRNLAENLSIYVETVAFKILIPIAFLILPGIMLIIAKVKKHA